MTATMKYTLQQIKDISFSGFEFIIPEDTVELINTLCKKVGSNGLKSEIFSKTMQPISSNVIHQAAPIRNNNSNKKRRGNKGMETSNDEWESILTFQSTKIEQKSGVDLDIDQIRLLMNKLTDKTFLDIKDKINEKMDSILSEDISEENIMKIGNMLYDLSSSNKFYSKIYAELFAELVTNHEWLRTLFYDKYDNIFEQYKNVQYVDPDKDYDMFCDINKQNEKRRSVTAFYKNLAINGLIAKDGIIAMLVKLLQLVLELIDTPNKKNEVDELTENIAILFDNDVIDNLYIVNEDSILDTIIKLAKSKTSDYESLSNKAIFKYMDLVDM
jgi:hypothetical protein